MKTITLGCVLILALMLTGNADAANSELVKKKTIVWQGIVPVAATFTVAKGETLEIRPGSKIVFSQGSGLVVQGAINAVGQKGKEIVFAAAKGQTPSSWNEIAFEAAKESRLEYCVIASATPTGDCAAGFAFLSDQPPSSQPQQISRNVFRF